MFCCTRKQQHYGEIVNSICLQQDCIKNKNQLVCPVCIQQQHKNHNLNTMKRILPQLLLANKQKDKYFNMLHLLLNFVKENFGQQNQNGQNIVTDNLIERVIQIMTDLKNKVDTNNQEIFKMKEIFKNLNKNNSQSSNTNSPIRSSVINSQIKKQSNNLQEKVNGSPIKNSKSVVLGINSNQKLKIQNSQINCGSIDTFSHSLKHNYLSLSNQNRTVLKNSHPEPNENQIQIKIDNCPSGNIMIGLCHQNIVKQRDFVNNYGTGHGTYLIGQNGNSQTAISFHHSINMMNRKQIVGWNFGMGDILTVGFNFAQEYIYFKVQKNKGKHQQFTMHLLSQDNINKQSIRDLVGNYGLKIIVLLQNVGDQVTLVQV